MIDKTGKLPWSGDLPMKITLCNFALVMMLFAQAAFALNADIDAPISIRADSAELDAQTGISVYRGNVVVKQGGRKILADEVEVTLVENQVQRIISRGKQKPVLYEQQAAADRVQIAAEAATMIYQVEEDRLHLEGNASLTQDGDRLRGHLITYQIDADTWTVFSSESEPVSLVFHPEPR